MAVTFRMLTLVGRGDFMIWLMALLYVFKISRNGWL